MLDCVGEGGGVGDVGDGITGFDVQWEKVGLEFGEVSDDKDELEHWRNGLQQRWKFCKIFAIHDRYHFVNHHELAPLGKDHCHCESHSQRRNHLLKCRTQCQTGGSSIFNVLESDVITFVLRTNCEICNL